MVFVLDILHPAGGYLVRPTISFNILLPGCLTLHQGMSRSPQLHWRPLNPPVLASCSVYQHLLLINETYKPKKNKRVLLNEKGLKNKRRIPVFRFQAWNSLSLFSLLLLSLLLLLLSLLLFICWSLRSSEDVAKAKQRSLLEYNSFKTHTLNDGGLIWIWSRLCFNQMNDGKCVRACVHACMRVCMSSCIFVCVRMRERERVHCSSI